jgi:sulfide:quinone oxidoreductase
MNIQQIGEDFFISGQIHPENMRELAARGIRGIICNRPDNEQWGQPDFSTIRAAAQMAGIEARYVPITHGRVTPSDEAAFREALNSLPKPVLGYCRSGARSASMYGAVAQRAA